MAARARVGTQAGVMPGVDNLRHRLPCLVSTGAIEGEGDDRAAVRQTIRSTPPE